MYFQLRLVEIQTPAMKIAVCVWVVNTEQVIKLWPLRVRDWFISQTAAGQTLESHWLSPSPSAGQLLSLPLISLFLPSVSLNLYSTALSEDAGVFSKWSVFNAFWSLFSHRNTVTGHWERTFQKYDMWTGKAKITLGYGETVYMWHFWLWSEHKKHLTSRITDDKKNFFDPDTLLLERGHLCEGRLRGLQVAGSSCLDFGRRFRAAVRVSAVFFCHGLDVATTAHPPAWNLIIFPQRRETAPVVLRHLWTWGEIR